MVPTFTQEQYEQILQLLRKDSEPTIHALTGTGLRNSSSFKTKTCWILDSGATTHMVSDFHSYEKYTSPVKNIKIPNGQRVLVTHIGNVCLFGGITLRDVLYAPELFLI